MKTVLIIALVCVAFALASDVKTATDDDFDQIIASSELVLMEFYAPWCGHCKKLAPEWEKAATAVKDQAVLAQLDATVHQKSAQKFGIQGYPTIKVFRDGQLSGDYDGGRTADTIEKWVKGNSGPAVTDVTAADQLEALKTENSVVVVFFGANSGEKYTGFETAAKGMRALHKFAVVSDSSLFGSETADSVVVFKHFDEKRNVYDGDFSAGTISSFVGESGIRLFDEIGPENYKGYVERKLPIGWLFIQPGSESGTAAQKVMEGIAADFKGKMSLVWIDADKYGKMAQQLGLKGDSFPALAIAHEERHFAFNEGATIEAAAVKEFFQNFLDGKLEETVKSEPAPEQHTVDGLTTLVGSNFGDIVNGETDILIEFYAPWCGHCKKLAPIYAELAKNLADNEGIKIAQIDATANDFPKKQFPVQGFPTIFFMAKGSAEPMPFEGDRSLEGFMTFLKAKSTANIN